MMVLPDDVLGNAAVRETNGKAAAMRRFANAKVSSRLRCHRRRKPTGGVDSQQPPKRAV